MSNIANDNVVVQGNFSSKKSSNGGSNSGGGDMDIAKRVDKLETKTDKLQESLNRIEITLAKIEGELKTKASREDLLKSEGEIKSRIALVEGKIDGLPKWIQLISLTILGAGIIGAMNFLLTFYMKSPLK